MSNIHPALAFYGGHDNTKGRPQSHINGLETFSPQPGLEVSPTPPKQYHAYNFDEKSSVSTPPSLPYSPRRTTRFPGISDLVVGILLGAVTAMVVVGAVLGGGLGASLKSCQTQVKTLSDTVPSNSTQATQTTQSPQTVLIASPTSTSSSPSASTVLKDYRASVPSTVDTLHNDCTLTAVTSVWGEKFSTDCNKDYNNGFAAAEGGTIADIVSLTAYSFGDCINACSGLNINAQRYNSKTRCRSVTFAVDMKNATSQDNSNCWLKNATLNDPNSGYYNPNSMSAKIWTS